MVKIDTKEQLAYVMDFYHITEFPIFGDRGTSICGKIVRSSKAKDGVEYSYHNSPYYYKDETIAFLLAYQQINNVIDVLQNMHTKTAIDVIYHTEKYTWEYADKEGGPIGHHTYPRTIYTNTEEKWEGTYDEVFEQFEKANNSLRYCNGHSYGFKDEEMRKKYTIWYNLIGESRRFDLYYGNGVVD